MNKTTPWTAYGWPKRVRDWRGMQAITKREMRNGFMRVPRGKQVTIGMPTHSRALRIEGELCECCEVSISISRVSWTDLEPVSSGNTGEGESDE